MGLSRGGKGLGCSGSRGGGVLAVIEVYGSGSRGSKCLGEGGV